MIISTDLIKRHKEYKKFIINNKIKVGEYWENIQVDFNSELSKYGWKNLGKQNFFPIKVDNIDQNGVSINPDLFTRAHVVKEAIKPTF